MFRLAQYRDPAVVRVRSDKAPSIQRSTAEEPNVVANEGAVTGKRLVYVTKLKLICAGPVNVPYPSNGNADHNRRAGNVYDHGVRRHRREKNRGKSQRFHSFYSKIILHHFSPNAVKCLYIIDE